MLRRKIPNGVAGDIFDIRHFDEKRTVFMKQSSGDLQNRKIREMLKQMIERDQVVPLAGTCQIGEGRPPDGKAARAVG